jgi:pimeloyl-ACP methyl ester carboxylesterase
MADGRIHRSVTDDGVGIAGRVSGQGSPLVLAHGQTGDGDLDWDPLLPWLTDRFTCFLPSTRGRGLSGRHPDVSLERRVQDLTMFVDSIGERVAVVGESAGGLLALGAAARTPAVGSVIAYEPPAPEAVSEDEARRLEQQVTQMARAVAEDRLTDAIRGFVGSVTNEEELAAFLASGYLEAASRYAALLLEELELEARPGAFSATHPAVLARVAVPVLLLHGERTTPRWLADAVHHVADHVPDAEVREITGAGHAGPLLAPAAVAAELSRFLAGTPARPSS